jgi:hypothetical protein
VLSSGDVLEQEAKALSDQDSDQTSEQKQRVAQPQIGRLKIAAEASRRRELAKPLASCIAAHRPDDRLEGFVLATRNGAYSQCRSGW